VHEPSHLLLALADVQPCLLWTSDDHGRCGAGNARWRTYTAWDGDGAADWRELLHPDDAPRVRALWREVTAGGPPLEAHARLRRSDGTYRAHVLRSAGLDGTPAIHARWCLTAVDVEDLIGSSAPARRATTERRRRSDPDAASQRSFQALADAAPAILWMTAADGSCTFLSRGWFDLTGQSPEEALGYGWLEAVHPDDRAASSRAFAEAIDGCAAFAIDHRVRRHDGSYRWVVDAGRPRFGQHGEFLGHVGSVIDMHERKLAEQTLQESEERFRQLADAMPQIVWTAGPDGTVEYFNRRWYEHTAALDSTGHGDGWLAVLHPDDRQRCLERWQHSVRTGEVYEIEYRFRFAKSGEYRWHLGRGLPVRDEAGAIVRWFGTSTDIDDHKRVSEALAESEERFRALADNITQFAWMADASGDILWYNRRWYDYTGTTLDEVRGRGWMRLHHPDHLERVVTRLQRSWDTGEEWEDTFPLRGRDGQYRWFLSRATPVRDAEGRILRWFGTNTDITDQRAAEAALREADVRKDEFLAMLAHELRNPLGPVSNAAQVLALVDTHDPAAKRAREIIDRQVQHIARLVDDLLDVSRISRGLVQLRCTRCDLDAVVAGAAEDYRPTLETNGLTLVVRRSGEPLVLDGDPTRLRQAVENLLHNALKFTHHGGEVIVEIARADAAAATVSVRDTGVGLDPALIANVFEPFTQADRSLDRSRGGLGLGLALVKGLVELHGGTVSADSPGVGCGARFTLRLPVAAGAIADAPAQENAPCGQLRLLVVEDNADAAESLRMLLALSGHDVEVAYDGPQALERIRARRPHVVLCDVGLPRGMDGYEVARRVRAEPAWTGVRLVAVTGYGQDEDVQRARRAGFDEHLVKPVDFDRLTAALRAADAR